jgi:hypothetical protein
MTDKPTGSAHGNGEEAAFVEIFEICAAEVKQREKKEEDWFLDSGANAHVTGNKALLTDIRDASKSTVTTAGSNSLLVMGHGKTNLDENKVIDNILYIPSMTKNLLSIGKFVDEGLLTLFGSRNCWIFDKQKP